MYYNKNRRQQKLNRAAYVAILDRARPRYISGTSPLTLPDTVDGYIKSVTVKGHSEKSKNLFNPNNVLEAYCNGTEIISWNLARTIYCSCKPNTTYTLSKTAGQKFLVASSTELPADGVSTTQLDATHQTAAVITVTTPANAEYLVAYVYSANSDTGTADEMLASCQIEEGSTATTYEPYGINSIGDAGWGVVDLGTLTWEYESSNSTMYVNLPTLTSIGTRLTPLVCQVYKALSAGETTVSDKSIYTSTTGTHFIVVKDSTYTDATVFKSAMSGVLLYYPLADATGATPTLGITSKDGAGQGTAATITTGLPLRSVSDTIYDTLDNDKVTKKCAEVDLGDFNWSRSTSYDNPFFYMSDSGFKAGSNNLCSDYASLSASGAEMFGNTAADKSIALGAYLSQIYVRDDRYSNAADFKAAVTGVKLIGELTTPTETALSTAEKTALAALRTYHGTTYVSATDNPVMSVEYSKIADTITRTRKKRTTKKRTTKK